MTGVRDFYILAFLSISTPCLSQDYDDVSSNAHLKWNGKCTPVNAGFNYNYRKGNSYETNYESYLSFYTCKGWYQSCDRSIEHAVRMDDYFLATSSCVQDYCSNCASDSCTSDCELYADMTMSSRYYSENGNNTYNGCSKAKSLEGLRYFYGPQCTDDGDLSMGYFFDKNCQLNATRRGQINSTESFIDFDVFSFVQSICSSCSYYGVCEGIYSSSFTCNEENGTLLSVGDGIFVVDELAADEKKRHLQEEDEADDIEGEAFEYFYDDYEYEEEEVVEEKEIRMTTLSFADEVCIEISSAEHLQQEINHNKTVHFLKETGIVLEDLMFVAIGFAVIVGVALLVVGRKYYARHRASWSRERREALYVKHRANWSRSRREALHDDKSFDEISSASTGGSRSIV